VDDRFSLVLPIALLYWYVDYGYFQGLVEPKTWKLTFLQSHTDSVERKLDVSRLMADSSWEMAVKDQDFYEDIESE